MHNEGGTIRALNKIEEREREREKHTHTEIQKRGTKRKKSGGCGGEERGVGTKE